MQQTYKNLCIRCGKERVVVRKWTEKIESGNITTTQSTCPDKECQKIVNQEIKAQKDKKAMLEQRKEERVQARKTENQKKRDKKAKKPS